MKDEGTDSQILRVVCCWVDTPEQALALLSSDAGKTAEFDGATEVWGVNFFESHRQMIHFLETRSKRADDGALR